MSIEKAIELSERLVELESQRDALMKQLRRSLALKQWIPDVFDGSGKVSHSITGSPSRGFVVRVNKANGEQFVCPIEDAPKTVVPKRPVFHRGVRATQWEDR